MRNIELKQDVAIETVKAAPAVVGSVIATLTLNEWVAVATFFYILLQAGVLIHKHYWRMKDRYAENKSKK